MSRVLLRAAVSAVLLSASDARKTRPDGEAALLSTGSKLKQRAVAAADDAVKEAEAELAKEMSSAEPEEETVEAKKKQKKVVKKKVALADADADFIKDGDDKETVPEDEKEEADDEDASEEDGTEDKAEKKDKDDDKKGAAKKDDAKNTATKDSKKETTKEAKKDDEKKETTKEAKKDDEKKETTKKGSAKKDDTKKTATKDSKKETTKEAKKEGKKEETTKVSKKEGKKEETAKVSKEDDKKEETSKAAKKDVKKEESKPVAKSDAEPKKSKDAKSDKKKDDKAVAKDATQGKKKEAAKQDKTKQSGKKDDDDDDDDNGTDVDGDEKLKKVADDEPDNETTQEDQTSSEAETQNKTDEEVKQSMPKFGTPKCPCVGLEGTKGNLTVSLGGNKTAVYPAEAFASCAAWDADSHPGCKKAGDGTRWCQQPWCLVDPCNCELDIAPKKVTGGYWPDGDFQGMGGYWYSYATCGGEDVWADKDSQKKMTDEPKECDKKVEETKWGDSGCQCIGVAGRQGNVDVEISGNMTARYSVDAGATCKAWDMDHHPYCQDQDPPDWCKQVWCYVDPCSCAIPVSPKVSNYMKGATWSGRPVYYSYHTCGGNDTYTGSQENACVNQQSDEECGNQSRCAWDGQQCLGKELVKVCRKAAKAVANASDAEEAELDEAAEKEERTGAKKREKSGALLPAAPFLATFLAFVASSS